MAELPHTGTEGAVGEFFILGLTSNGRQFRPSDWAERLCGVMSCFRPEGSGGRNAHLQFSPYVHPTVIDGVKAVVVNNALKKGRTAGLSLLRQFRQRQRLASRRCLLRRVAGRSQGLSFPKRLI